jgi:2-polyprenyl-3-methyl-5-hydroxy-6-metoxy-1,4-benzoquinol methylase
MDLREWWGELSVRHPWETARAGFFRRAVAEITPGPVRVLDVGAGDGFLSEGLLAALAPGSEITCFDPHYSDEHLAQLRRARPALRFTRELDRPEAPAGAPPDRRGAAFDRLLLLDVVEHVPEDRAFLRGLVAERLAPGAIAVISVPAWPLLYSRHDLALGHYRRYTPKALRALVADAGLELLAHGNLFGSLLPARALGKALEVARGRRAVPPEDGTAPAALGDAIGVGRWSGGRPLTRAIEAALACDAALSRAAARAALPLPGLSTWAIARKPGA